MHESARVARTKYQRVAVLTIETSLTILQVRHPESRCWLFWLMEGHSGCFLTWSLVCALKDGVRKNRPSESHHEGSIPTLSPSPNRLPKASSQNTILSLSKASACEWWAWGRYTMQSIIVDNSIRQSIAEV